MKTVRKYLDSILMSSLALILAVMVLNVIWQVLSRYILSTPSSFSDELARYLLIWLGTLGAAYVSGLEKHLAIDLLPMSLRGQARERLMKVIHVSIAFFGFTAMGIGGANLVLLSNKLGQVSPALGVPLSVVYAIIPVSGLIITFYALYFMIYPSDVIEKGGN